MSSSRREKRGGPAKEERGPGQMEEGSKPPWRGSERRSELSEWGSCDRAPFAPFASSRDLGVASPATSSRIYVRARARQQPSGAGFNGALGRLS